MSKRSRTNSFEDIARQRPETFWPEVGKSNGKAVAVADEQAETQEVCVDDEEVEEVEAEPVEAPRASRASQPAKDDQPSADLAPIDRDRLDLLLACGDGMELTVDQAKQDIDACTSRIFDDLIRIGKRLILIKEKLPYGDFVEYVESDEFPMGYRSAAGYMMAARRILSSQNPQTYDFFARASGGSIKKMKLLLKHDDAEVQKAMDTGDFLGRPISEIGEMSYGQLRAEERKLKRDLARARDQRDAAESKVEDLKEEVRGLRDVHHRPASDGVSDVHVSFLRARTAMENLVELARGAEPSELAAHGAAWHRMLVHLLRDVGDALMPTYPGETLDDDEDLVAESLEALCGDEPASDVDTAGGAA